MKKLLFLIVLLPMMAFSQVSSWRSNPPQPRTSTPSVQGQRSDISLWRTDGPREFNRPKPTKPGSNIIINNNPWGWGWNRWNLWGAPTFGFNYWNPYWYYNDLGYRQPARIYIYENGKTDTIIGRKPIVNFVLSKTTNNQIGASVAIGGKNYFIADFITTYELDRSTFFRYGTIDKVDFPLISDLKKERTIYLGAGKRIKRTGYHALIGFGTENVYWRGKDAYGEITFPKSQTQFTTIKIGAMRDLKNFTFKFDTDPIRGYSQFGIGLNF